MKRDGSDVGQGLEARSSRQGIQVIARAVRVLRALEAEDAGLSLGQIAQRVDLPRSTVQRIVEALSAEHFLVSGGPGAGVRLGPALLRMASSATLEFSHVTRPIIRGLSRELGETVDLSVLRGVHAVFVDQAPGSQRLRAVSAVGERFPLYCTANGKALLSVLPDETARRLVGEALAASTDPPATSVAAVMREVAIARQAGVAFDPEEHTEGICAVGCAYLDPLGHAMAISIPAPAVRFARRKDELVEHLLAARARVVEALRLPHGPLDGRQGQGGPE